MPRDPAADLIIRLTTATVRPPVGGDAIPTANEEREGPGRDPSWAYADLLAPGATKRTR